MYTGRKHGRVRVYTAVYTAHICGHGLCTRVNDRVTCYTTVYTAVYGPCTRPCTRHVHVYRAVYTAVCTPHSRVHGPCPLPSVDTSRLHGRVVYTLPCTHAEFKPYTRRVHGCVHGHVRPCTWWPCTPPCTRPVHGHGLCTRPCIRSCTRPSLRSICTAEHTGRKDVYTARVHGRLDGRVHMYSTGTRVLDRVHGRYRP